MTVLKHAAKYPDDMEVCGDKMMRRHCGIVVQHAQKTFVVNHEVADAQTEKEGFLCDQF